MVSMIVCIDIGEGITVVDCLSACHMAVITSRLTYQQLVLFLYPLPIIFVKTAFPLRSTLTPVTRVTDIVTIFMNERFFGEVRMRLCRYMGIGILTVILFTGSANAAAEKKEFVAKVDPDGVQRVEVLAGSYFFDPNYIIVKVNVPVEMKIKKEPGMIPHDIVLKAPEAGMDIKLELSDSPQIMRFTPTKTGEFPFYCDKKLLFFESHRDKGMVGTLEVRD